LLQSSQTRDERLDWLFARLFVLLFALLFVCLLQPWQQVMGEH
jgi:hypothetical protein